MDDARLGATLGDRYRLVRVLGRGGMGVVYEAEQPGGDRVALKLMHTGDADANARARFQREARAASRVDHPNVVRVIDVGTFEGDEFLVMEYVEGPTLQATLADGPLGVTRALAIAHQVLEGLEAIHAAGIVHRDIKPANLVLTGERVKIVDFGIARSVALDGTLALTLTGQVIGTPTFMPPEQMVGTAIDERADLYAVGVTLYVMLTGQKPFDATSFTELAMQQLLQTLPAVTNLRADLPPALASVLSRALERSADQRYPNARAFRDALSEIDDPIRARLVASLERHRGRIAEVARELDQPRMQIHRWIEDFGLDLDAFVTPR